MSVDQQKAQFPLTETCPFCDADTTRDYMSDYDPAREYDCGTCIVEAVDGLCGSPSLDCLNRLRKNAGLAPLVDGIHLI